MPLTHRRSAGHIKQPDGTYKAFDSFVDRSTAEIIEDLKAAEATQEAALLAKAEEINQSLIGRDWTELNEDVRLAKELALDHEPRLTANEKTDAEQNRRLDNLEAVAKGYLYREDVDSTEAYEKHIDVSILPAASLDLIGCKTIGWNQGLKNGNFATTDGITTTNGTVMVEDNVATYTVDTSVGGNAGNQFGFVNALQFIEGHVVFATMEIKATQSMTVYIGDDLPFAGAKSLTAGKWNRFYGIAVANAATGSMYVGVDVNMAVSAGASIQARNWMFFDLTAMFGNGNEPDAETFRAMFPADYYEYAEPTLLDCSPDRVLHYGANMMDPSLLVSRYKMVDGVITGTSTSGYYSSLFPSVPAGGSINLPEGAMSNVIQLDPTKSYTVSINNTPSSIRLVFYKADGIYTNAYATALSNSAKVATCPASKEARYLNIQIPSKSAPVAIDGLQITATDRAVPFHLYHDPDVYDLSSLVQKYFPDGMHSAGGVYDAFEVEDNGSVWAIQRVGLTDLGEHVWKFSDTFGYTTSIETLAKYDSGRPNLLCHKYKTVDAVGSSGLSVLNKVITTRRANTTLIVRDMDLTLDDFVDSVNGVMLCYELSTPNRTEVTEDFPADLLVEAGGRLVFSNVQGDDFHIPLPNQETFMTALMGVN